MNLPLYDPCRGCGACCTHVGVPPGYDPPIAEGSPDYELFLAIPEALRDELRDYYQAVWAGKTEDRSLSGNVPCLWFDLETRRCRHYEHRPNVCRTFEIGGASCLGHRERMGIKPSHPKS